MSNYYPKKFCFMRKVITLALTILLCSASVQAQSWLDALKGVATSLTDEITQGKLTEMAIVGSWNYSSPGLRMGSSDMLSNVAGSAMESTLESKLSTYYQKIGIVAGGCSITLTDDDKFTLKLKGKSVDGTYTYEAESHHITLTISKLNLKVGGYAYIDGGNLDLLFKVDKLVKFVTAIGSNIDKLRTITSALEVYDEVMLGFKFEREK